ncbi:SDR family NAD(P)-dependent oxidoreductase [Butyrivibrio sp. XPD2006]|uniref:SDR family NAD(P)-dependent oxidoreductase n=1 Tax=Butyrivibrio sp. XPD2006 TaxID=1280668 RepID=UPI0003B7611B|nr:SDR family oxidoreductase [Butyrivibrio sp. XPD2006]
MMIDVFKDKNVMIIGASSGIGEQTARLVNQYGGKTILISRNIDKLCEIKNELGEKSCCAYEMDISDLNNIGLKIASIISETGPLDGLVYSAGVSRFTPIAQAKPEIMQNVFNTNFFGFVECVRQVSRKGRFNPGLRVVGVSSVSSFHGNKARIAYCSSKAAMNSAVQCMALELSKKGICVNAVAPSLTNTNMFKAWLENSDENAEAVNNLLSRQYLGVAEPLDIANAIVYLLSPQARFITGITLPVDGGATTS